MRDSKNQIFKAIIMCKKNVIKFNQFKNILCSCKKKINKIKY